MDQRRTAYWYAPQVVAVWPQVPRLGAGREPRRLIGLAFTGPGVAGIVTVMAVELAIIISMSLYNPVLATYRLEHTPGDRVTRALSAWSIGQQVSIAIFTALGGLLAGITSPRTSWR
jgi:MFS family permease